MYQSGKYLPPEFIQKSRMWSRIAVTLMLRRSWGKQVGLQSSHSSQSSQSGSSKLNVVIDQDKKQRRRRESRIEEMMVQVF